MLCQVLFASDASLADPERRALLRGFLRATFEGWHEARRAPHAAAEAVMATVAALGHQKDGKGSSGTWLGTPTDHYEHTLDFHAASVAKCCDYVRRARCAGTCQDRPLQATPLALPFDTEFLHLHLHLARSA